MKTNFLINFKLIHYNSCDKNRLLNCFAFCNFNLPFSLRLSVEKLLKETEEIWKFRFYWKQFQSHKVDNFLLVKITNDSMLQNTFKATLTLSARFSEILDNNLNLNRNCISKAPWNPTLCLITNDFSSTKHVKDLPFAEKFRWYWKQKTLSSKSL